MADPLRPIGFISFAGADDIKSEGRLRQVRLQLMQALHDAAATPADVKVWQADTAIPQSGRWLGEVPRAIGESNFFVPIVTPEFLRSEACCQEVMRFRKREIELERNDLIFPLVYIETSNVNPRRARDCADPEVFALLQSRSGIAFHDLRLRDPESHAVGERIAGLAAAIDTTLRHAASTPRLQGDKDQTLDPLSRDAGGMASSDTLRAGSKQRNRKIRAGEDTMVFPWRLALGLILIAGVLGGYTLDRIYGLSDTPAAPVVAAAPPRPVPDAAGEDKPPPNREPPKPLSEQQDCPHCPVMVFLPPGTFTMGVQPDEEKQAKVPEEYRNHAFPAHVRSIPEGFHMGKYPVTRREYAAFVLATGRADTNGCYIWVQNREQRGTWVLKPEITWRDPGFGALEMPDNQPVVCVSHRDAQDYVKRLSLQVGRVFHLPTEAEWEYAARGVTSADTASPPRYWGEAESCLFANVADQSLAAKWGGDKGNPDRYFKCNDRYPFTAPVGYFLPNAFNLHDMLGNVWQWTADCWHENYTERPTSDHQAWDSPVDCKRRVERGGSWDFEPWAVRSGFRIGVDSNYRDTNSGFRVASYEPAP